MWERTKAGSTSRKNFLDRHKIIHNVTLRHTVIAVYFLDSAAGHVMFAQEEIGVHFHRFVYCSHEISEISRLSVIISTSSTHRAVCFLPVYVDVFVSASIHHEVH